MLYFRWPLHTHHGDRVHHQRHKQRGLRPVCSDKQGRLNWLTAVAQKVAARAVANTAATGAAAGASLACGRAIAAAAACEADSAVLVVYIHFTLTTGMDHAIIRMNHEDALQSLQREAWEAKLAYRRRHRQEGGGQRCCRWYFRWTSGLWLRHSGRSEAGDGLQRDAYNTVKDSV